MTSLMRILLLLVLLAGAAPLRVGTGPRRR